MIIDEKNLLEKSSTEWKTNYLISQEKLKLTSDKFIRADSLSKSSQDQISHLNDEVRFINLYYYYYYYYCYYCYYYYYYYYYYYFLIIIFLLFFLLFSIIYLIINYVIYVNIIYYLQNLNFFIWKN